MSELLKGIEPCFVPVVTVRFCHGTNELPSGSASAELITKIYYSRPPSSVAAHPHFVRLSCLRHFKAATIRAVPASQISAKCCQPCVQARGFRICLISVNSNSLVFDDASPRQAAGENRHKTQPLALRFLNLSKSMFLQNDTDGASIPYFG